MSKKVKWEVSEPLSGRYQSFYRRGWPSAFYKDGSSAAFITCEDEYLPADVKTGNHKELTLHISNWSCFTPEKGLTRVVAKLHPKTLKEAKDLLDSILTKYPHLMPKVQNES